MAIRFASSVAGRAASGTETEFSETLQNERWAWDIRAEKGAHEARRYGAGAEVWLGHAQKR